MDSWAFFYEHINVILISCNFVVIEMVCNSLQKKHENIYIYIYFL